MASGGLGWTDRGKKEVMGGYSLDFFERVGQKYGRRIEWYFEPHVAEEVFNELAGKVFMDASYEGDLLARAGVSYTWGREAIKAYDESLAVYATERRCTSSVPPARRRGGKLRPEITPRADDPVGAADKRAQDTCQRWKPRCGGRSPSRT
jgi:FAD dependent oxidoreductase